MRAVWPGMMTRGYGRILNTSSGAALGSGISGAYAPSKSGIIGLTKDAAISGRPHGIHINAIMPTRSEEHTSELQSLMRISYAVFCLKKKKTYTKETRTHVSTMRTKNKKAIEA